MRTLRLLVIGSAVTLGLFLLARWIQMPVPSGDMPGAPPRVTPSSPAALATGAHLSVEVVATGLEVPWALAFASPRPSTPLGVNPSIPLGAPRGTIEGQAESRGPDLYVTERPGRLVRMRDGRVEKLADIPEVQQTAEGGLLGLALDPLFAENGLLYLYHSYRVTSAGTLNRVVRYHLTDQGLTEPRILLDGIPGARFHDGGRLAFGPEGNLYITTGDATKPALAQDRVSLAGKILRIRTDGSIPPNNPWPDSPVYSLGHRNSQGLAWAADGTLYSTEHGPSGEPPDCCHDEVNRIGPGRNYGWPLRAGTFERSGPQKPTEFVDPLAESGPRETWAPAGAAVVGETLYFAGLRGQALYALNLENPTSVQVFFKGEFGRLRDVVRGPDGALYLTTSNRDGRGVPRPDDDRILRVDPARLPGTWSPTG